MDLITAFPHVRQTERGPRPEDGCDERTRSSKSVERAQSTSVSNMLNDGKGLSESLKEHDAKAARRASCEIARRNSIGPNSKDKDPPEAVPLRNEQTLQQDGVFNVMHQRHTKKQGSTDGRQGGLSTNQRSSRNRKKKTEPSGASRPSLTLWVLSLVAAVIWMRVFFVEQQPVMKTESTEMNSIRFAEAPVTSYHQEKSRQ